jgi:hypothetical protein
MNDTDTDIDTDTDTDIELEAAVNKYHELLKKYKDNSIKDFTDYVNDPTKTKLQTYKKKYTHIKKKIGKNTTLKTIEQSHVGIYEFIKLTNESFTTKFSEEEIKLIITYNINKIQGIYKHAQALKTGYCNLQIMNALSKDELTFAIAKNTLEAGGQWQERIFKDLNYRWPQESIKNKVMIISSKSNKINKDLKDNATHCKNITDAWILLSKKNEFSVIFVCSNNTRINDIYQLTTLLQNLLPELRKNINIIHDEAHNAKEGIPPFRDTIENIILQPIVNIYIPCTASNNSIIVEENPLWKKENIENKALDYSNFDNTISTDPKYSSIGDAKKYKFEDLSSKPKWIDEKIEEVSIDDFMKCEAKYENKNIDNLSEDELNDIDKRRQLEYCQFMENDQEIKAMNHGINVLNMNELIGKEVYQPNKFNLHIISTPRRKIITRLLAKEAVKKDYNPIVLAIYGNQGNKFHLFYDNKEKLVDKEMGSGEFNQKINNLLEYLKKMKVNTERPLIIIANYSHTGESLSFVNCDYGIVRGNTRLISTNADEDYQQAARGNYMNTRFIEKNPKWKNPEKFLVGESKYMYNALAYEKENDSRNIEMKKKHESGITSSDINTSTPIEKIDTINGTVACPIKFEIQDDSHESVIELINIMKKTTRTEDDKKEFMKLLKECVESQVITMNDPFKKFNFEFKLVDFRCWKKQKLNGASSSTDVGVWKFKNYKMNHDAKTPFINNNRGHIKNDCELCSSLDFYRVSDKDGESFINNRNTFWIGYKY